MKKRMLSQDIVKGLAILVVCQLHALQLTKEIFYPLVALFGFIMPVFMFLSGYNYHQKQVAPVILMKKRVGFILKVYLIWCFLMLAIMGPYFYFHKDGTISEILTSFAAHLLSESGCNRLIKAIYHLLTLQTFITAGEMEVKAWTFRRGWKAPQCAGVIHTDFEKGFIRAEVIKYEDYIKYGSEAAVREAGKMSVEGKDYVVQDGDIMHFRFNV